MMKNQLLSTLWLLSVLVWSGFLALKIGFYLDPIYNKEMNIVLVNGIFWYSLMSMLMLSIFLFVCIFLMKTVNNDKVKKEKVDIH